MSLRTVRLLSATLQSTLSLTKVGVHVKRREYAYGKHPAERLDHLVPPGDVGPNAVMYFHGGGWVAGNKRYYTKDLNFLVQAGYPVFNVGYPLAPEFPHPHALRAVLKAVAWIREHHPEITALHMMGDSAGGNLAAMYGVLIRNPHLLQHIHRDATVDDLLPANSVVALYGVLDRETCLGDEADETPGIVRLFFQSYGGSDTLSAERLAPARAITPMDLDWRRHPRCFIGVGDRDFLQASSARYAGHLGSLGIETVHKVYPGAPHGFINLPHEQTPLLKRDVLDFLGDA